MRAVRSEDPSIEWPAPASRSIAGNLLPRDAEVSHESTSWRRWNLWIISVLAAAAMSLPIVNVFVDPFDLFMVSPLGSGPTTSQRLHLVSALRKGMPDVLLLGDSIVGINDPRQMLDGTRSWTSAYNASVFMASAVDIRDIAKFVAAQRVKPKLVVVALDSYMFTGQPQGDTLMLKMPPEISHEGFTRFWTQALFAPSVFQAIDKISDKFGAERSVAFDLALGHYSRPSLDREMAGVTFWLCPAGVCRRSAIDGTVSSRARRSWLLSAKPRPS